MTITPGSIPISVLIPAKNEEENLPACLASLVQADEVFVVDSQKRGSIGCDRREFGR